MPMRLEEFEKFLSYFAAFHTGFIQTYGGGG
jgi:hypothetical protein